MNERPPYAWDVLHLRTRATRLPELAFDDVLEAVASGVLTRTARWQPVHTMRATALLSGALRGSIHQVGAALQNAPSCNGWTFWHFERGGVLLPLDTLRADSTI